MPPLICGSPVLLDQSFPRSVDELRLVATTLGEIEKQVEDNEIHLILTEGLVYFIDAFDWHLRDSYPLLIEIYNLLCQWFLQPHERLIRVDLSNIHSSTPHPVPEGCTASGLVDFWADEIGKLLVKHDMCCPYNKYFIGIACELAYSGSPPREYENPNNLRAFPLVGPNEIPSKLIDAYEWEIPVDIHQKSVSVENIFTSYTAIGGIRINRPSSGSHYKVIFPHRRSWVLDPNVDPIPDDFLNELVSITGYPLKVIKYCLITGTLPRKVSLIG